MDSTSVCYFYSEWGFSYPRAWVNYHPQQLLQNTKGQSTQHSCQQSKEEINFLRVAGIQGTNYHRRKIVSNGSILWYGLFLKPTQASKVRLIWNTQTSPMALFLITGVPICGENRLSTGIVENVLQSYEKWFWLYMEISPTKFLAAVQCRNIVAGIFELRELQLTQ